MLAAMPFVKLDAPVTKPLPQQKAPMRIERGRTLTTFTLYGTFAVTNPDAVERMINAALQEELGT
jgi:hypothetical protein